MSGEKINSKKLGDSEFSFKILLKPAPRDAPTNNWCPHPELNWKLILTMDVLYHLTIRAIFNSN